MIVGLFNFLDDNAQEIVSRTEARVRRERKEQSRPAPGPTFKALLARLCDGYVDLLVTGQSEVLDRVYRSLVRVLPLHGLRFSDVFAVPLTMSAVIREMLTEKQAGGSAVSPPETLTGWIDRVELEAHRATGRFLDSLQDHLYTMVTDHNAYLRTVGEQAGTDIAPLRIGRKPR